MEYADVIKLVSRHQTGFYSLCLEICITKSSKTWNLIFLSENFPGNENFKLLKSDYSDNMTEIYLLFYQAVLPCFTNFNRLLQSEEPLLYKLHQVQQRFMCKLASHFFEASIIQQHKEESKSFSALSILPDNQKDDIDLGVRR